MRTTHGATAESTPQAKIVEAMAAPIAVAYKTYFLDLPMAMTGEALRFAGHRLEEQAKLLTNLSACKTVSDMAETQSGFFNGAIADYNKEAGIFAHRANQAIVASNSRSLSTG